MFLLVAFWLVFMCNFGSTKSSESLNAIPLKIVLHNEIKTCCMEIIFSFEVFQNLFKKYYLWNYSSHDAGFTYFPFEIHLDILLVRNTTAIIPVF